MRFGQTDGLFSHTPGAVRSRTDARRRRLRGEEPPVYMQRLAWFDAGEPIGDPDAYVAVTVRTKSIGE